MPCPSCQGGEVEYNPAEGNSFCRDCGLVLEENAVVNDVTFGESASGQATVFGSHVGANKFGVAVVGPGGRRQQVGTANDQSVQNGRSYIVRFANGLNLTERYTDAGMRYYNLALASRFTKGRSTEHVAAACLYAACRQEGGNKMLIDFSELLRVNVFVLGGVYLKLVKLTGIRLPPVDPSFFMLRFAAALQFAELTEKVSEDGCRLVKRFKADWMHTGRRPSGVCGAALLISARMHNFYRTIQEVAQVVKVAPATIRKRLQEFAETPSADLNVKDFRAGIWLDKAQDPPSFRRARRMTVQSEEASQSGSSCSTAGRSTSSVSSAGAGTSSIAAAAADQARTQQTELSNPHCGSKPSGMTGVAGGSAHRRHAEVTGQSADEGGDTQAFASEPSTRDPATATAEPVPTLSDAGEHDGPARTAESTAVSGSKRPREDGENEDSAAEAERCCKKGRTAISADEVVNELLHEAEQIPRAEMGLSDLDDDSEIDEVLHTEQEVLEKRRVWEAHNKDWEEAQEAKYRLAIERGEDPHAHRVRKRGGTRKIAGANSATAADSVKKHLESKLSSKINYAAVDNMFEEDPLAAVARAKARGSVTGYTPMAMALMGESDGTLSRTRSSASASRFRSLGRSGPAARRNILGRAFGLTTSHKHPYEV